MGNKSIKPIAKKPVIIRSNKEKILRQMIRRFTEEEVIPKAQEFDETKQIPKEIFLTLGEMGAFGMRYPVKDGGSGGNTTLYCIICEELARGLMSLAAITAMQGLMGTNFLYHYGTDEHREKYFKPAMKGEVYSAFCLTEPDNSSDLIGCKTTAVRDGDNWVINGMKTWITNASKASFYTVLVQTNPGSGAKGLNFCLIDKNLPGVSHSERFDLVGTRSSDLGEVAFTDVVIPNENMLIPEGQGIRALLSILAEIRTMTGALGLGLAKAAYESSVQYAKERSQFGRLIKDYQLIQAHITNMASRIYASELMLKDCCAMIDRGENPTAKASMVKYFLCETACDAADRATRVLGGYSYSTEYPVQRYFRDTRFLLYGGGTHEILQSNIGRELLR